MQINFQSKILKLSIGIILALLVSLIIVYYINDWFRSTYDPETKQQKWYEQISSIEDDKIFLIGSSHVIRLNATFIENFLDTNNHNVSVYNLGISGDRESNRLQFIDDIIHANPKVVVFGVGYSSFVLNSVNNPVMTDIKTSSSNILPDAGSFFKELTPIIFPFKIDSNNFQNPKFSTLSIIYNFLGTEKLPNTQSALYKNNQPFSIDGRKEQIPKSSEDIEKLTNFQYLFVNYPSKDKPNILALKKMIQELKENHIKVILFLSPHHQLIWDKLEKTKYERFLQEIDQLSDELDQEIYDLHNKYSEFNIWYDATHISKLDNHYSNDIAKIILKEIRKNDDAYPIIHMNDITSSYGVKITKDRQLHSEFISPTSQLVGAEIDTIVLKLRKIGNPIGIAQVGVFNEDLSLKQLFSNFDPSTLFEYYAEFTFSLPPSEIYSIQSGDRIGIKYEGGDPLNFVEVMIDNNPSNPFDGTNSYYAYFKDEWLSFSQDDMYMILKDRK